MNKRNALTELVSQSEIASFLQKIKTATAPAVLRGLCKHWPLVSHGTTASSLGSYFAQFSNDKPIQCFHANASEKGRYFYNAVFDGFNFSRQRTTLTALCEQLCQQDESAGSYYMGSTAVDYILPGLRTQNDISTLSDAPLVSLWLGNRSIIAAHYDSTQNLACVLAGKRRFRILAPEYADALYPGPIDFTPAGQPASLVDFNAPNYQAFPKFAEAEANMLDVTLLPGDAIFIPALWWHHVQADGHCNAMMNYWWRNAADYAPAPMDAMMLSIIAIRDLPEEERKVWQRYFKDAVFEPTKVSHIPEHARGILGKLSNDTVRKVRQLLLQKLNR